MENTENMDTAKKLSNFCREVKARLKGDTEEIVAAKNERKATAAIEGQINALKSILVDKEDKVTEAEEALGNIIYPVELITNPSGYVAAIKEKQEILDRAQEDLESTQETLNYFTTLLKEKF